MRPHLRSAPLILTLLALASIARAQAPLDVVHLRWDDCGAYGAAARTFACDTNAGSDVLVGSFVAPAGLSSLVGFTASLIVDNVGYPPPPWWSIQTGGCHSGALAPSFDFTVGPSHCYDYWAGQAAGGLDYRVGYCDPYDPFLCYDEAQLRLVASVPTGAYHPIAAGTEVYAFKVFVRHTKSVGTGACAGCAEGACIAVSELSLVQPVGVGDFIYQNNFDPNPPRVSWNGGVAAGHAHGFAFACDAATPARRPTWGALKAIYR